MKLEEYLRAEYTFHIRPLFIKNKCEICESKQNLHLHHDKQFDDMVQETLKDLNLKYKDTKDYTPIELQNISNIIIGKQIKCKYHTLCNNCHMNIHAGKQNTLYYEIQRKKKDIIIEKYINDILTPYLESIINKRLDRDEQKTLINIVNSRKNGKQQKSYNKLNEYFKKYNLPYIIKKADIKYYKGKNEKFIKEKTRWIVYQDKITI